MSSADILVKVIDPNKDSYWALKINQVLTEASAMFKESNGGHVPDDIVTNIVHRQYTSMESITRTFCETAYRFVVIDNARNELIGTLLVGRCADTILVKDSRNINVSTAQYRGFSPENYHHAFNFAINMRYRNQNYATYLLSEIQKKYRSLFSGQGMWIHAEPPWHEVFTRMGFHHAIEYDQFFFEDVELPRSAPTIRAFNNPFICDCEKSEDHLACLEKYKYKYQVFTMEFADAPVAANTCGAIL